MTTDMTAEHHPFCNYWGAGPAETCKWCKGYFAKYPVGDKAPEELVEIYFPNVISRGTYEDDH